MSIGQKTKRFRGWNFSLLGVCFLLCAHPSRARECGAHCEEDGKHLDVESFPLWRSLHLCAQNEADLNGDLFVCNVQ